MPAYAQIFENNRRWLEENLRKDPHFLDRLRGDQKPGYLYIGCSDSRVTAEELMGVGPGEVFVHRNVANMFNGLDLSASSVLNYAVRHLQVQHVVVCGHYNCGGVKAAMQSKDLDVLNPWLRAIRDVYRLHAEELDGIANESERYDRLVELNVQEQCVNVLKTAEVQEAYHTRGLTVHGWVFDLRTGLLKDLLIDFPAILRNVEKIYDLYGDGELTS